MCVNANFKTSMYISLSILCFLKTLEKPKGPKQAPTRWGNPSSKCSNDWSRNKCSKKMRRGKCTKSWVQKKCKATCRVCCGDIWSEKRCVPRFKGCGKSKRVTNNCRRTCLKC